MNKLISKENWSKVFVKFIFKDAKINNTIEKQLNTLLKIMFQLIFFYFKI